MSNNDWAEFCTEMDGKKVLEIAEKMVANDVDFKFFQNYFFNEQSSLIRGKSRDEIKTFTQSELYRKLRDLGDVLGFKQGYVKPARKKKK